jgi:hypothetical protein
MNPNINTINNFSGGGNPGGQDVSCADRIKAAWGGVPLFVRFVFMTTLVFYVLSFFLSVGYALANIPYFSLRYFNIWRFVTTVLVTSSIFNVLFAFISWIPDAIRLENTSGTVRYMLNFFVNSTLIQIIYSILALMVSPITTSYLYGNLNPLTKQVDNNGLWPLIMAEITLLCLVNPENPVMFFFIPYQFRAKFYPFVLLGFFSLFNGIQLDLISGVIYAYLFFYYLRQKLQFSDQFIVSCENSFIFKHLSKFAGFISLQSTGGSGYTTNYNQQGGSSPNTTNAGGTYTMDRPQNPVSTPFKGKGTVVGNLFYI